MLYCYPQFNVRRSHNLDTSLPCIFQILEGLPDAVLAPAPPCSRSLQSQTALRTGVNVHVGFHRGYPPGNSFLVSLLDKYPSLLSARCSDFCRGQAAGIHSGIRGCCSGLDG